MDYIELARQLSGNTSSAITRKTATATSASTNGTVQIDVGGNNITVPTIGNIGEGDTVEYIVQDGMPVAVGTKGAGDALRDNVEGLQTLIRETTEGNLEVAKVNESGGYVGTHTEMTADAFEIHDASHNKLASFGRKTINLGSADTDATINLCGENGSIKAMAIGDDVYISVNGTYGALLNAENTNFGYARVVSNTNAEGLVSASMGASYDSDHTAEVLAFGGTPSQPAQLTAKADTIHVQGSININDKLLSDHITQSYTSGNWYVECYASGLVKQYWYGLASFATSVGWVAQQAYPIALSAVYSAQATGGDYRVTQLYTAPMEQSGAACYIGGMASAAHQSNVSLCVIGMAAS